MLTWYSKQTCISKIMMLIFLKIIILSSVFYTKHSLQFDKAVNRFRNGQTTSIIILIEIKSDRNYRYIALLLSYCEQPVSFFYNMSNSELCR